MKTLPLSAPLQEQGPLFSAEEMSIGDSLMVRVGDAPVEKTRLLKGLYTAILCFRNKRPFLLTSSKCPDPLVSYQNKTLFVHPAIQTFVMELEAICTSEQQAGMEILGSRYQQDTGKAPVPSPG